MIHPLIVPIVEGHGEIEAVPLLLRRLRDERSPEVYLKINPPIRIKVGSFLKDENYFKKYIELACAKAKQGRGLVLILLDCEDDCPADVGPDLLRKVKSIRDDVDYLVVLAYREYESWFIAAAESLRGCSGLPHNLSAPDNIEAIRAAKEWLGRRMPNKYDPLIHQVEFTKQIDFDLASAVSSFRRFREKIHAYLSKFDTRA